MTHFDIFSVREYFPSADCPSASTWVYNQAKEIQKYGINPLVISPMPFVPRGLKMLKNEKYAWKIKPSEIIQDYKGVNVIRPLYFKLPGKYFLHFNLKKFSDCLIRATLTIDTKLIHAHFGHAGIASIELKRKKKLPLITSFYGYDLGSDKKKLIKYYQRLIREGDLFLVLSEDMKKDLTEIGFPDDKIIIHHLGIDTDEFIPDEHAYNSQKNFIFSLVALSEERKGIYYTIKAFQLFKKNNKDINCQLRIIGDTTFSKRIKKLTKTVQDVIFINSYSDLNPRKLILNEMQKSNVFILTSITTKEGDKEGTPVVLMEAQSCGKPCISTFHAGIPEVVIHNKTGILSAERDIQSIANAMSELYYNNSIRLEFGINARNHIIENYNNHKQIPELFSIYQSLIGQDFEKTN